MDIDRLNKIREICFKKSKSRTNKHQSKKQPNQIVVNSIRSPFSSRGRVMDKENSQNHIATIEIKNCNSKGDTYKNLEKQVNQLYDIKQKRLEANVIKFNERLKQKRQLKEKSYKQPGGGHLLYRTVSSHKGNQRSNSPM